MSDGLESWVARMLRSACAGALVQGAFVAIRVARMLDKGSGTTELESMFPVKTQCSMFCLKHG